MLTQSFNKPDRTNYFFIVDFKWFSLGLSDSKRFVVLYYPFNDVRNDPSSRVTDKQVATRNQHCVACDEIFVYETAMQSRSG